MVPWFPGEWFIDRTWFLWPSSIWVLAGAIVFLAFCNSRMTAEFKKTRIGITTGIEKIITALNQETGQLKAVMNELNKDNFLLKDTTNKLTNELTKTRTSIDNLHNMWQRFYDFWGYPHSERESKTS